MDEPTLDAFTDRLSRRREEAVATLLQIEALTAKETQLIEIDSARIEHRRRERLQYLSDEYRADLAEIERASQTIVRNINSTCGSYAGEVDLPPLGAFPETELRRSCNMADDDAISGSSTPPSSKQFVSTRA